MSENTELMAIPQELYVAPVVPLEEAKSKFEQVRKYTSSCLTKGVDYGNFDGVSKPSLLKPGAEKIGSLFGLSPRFECVDKVLNFTGEGNPDHEPFFYFEYRCNLYKGDQFVGSCDGSCNSWEKKYRYRKGGLKCPNCGKETIIKNKYADGYYCNKKRGGCGSNFRENDARIISQSIEDVKNFDTAEQVNTFQKMAQKRAYVGAILIACNLSEYYTQDIEDMDKSSYTPEYIDADYTPLPDDQQPQQKKKFELDEVKYLREWKHMSGLPVMLLETACEMETEKGTKKMGECTVTELYFMKRAYENRMKNPDANKEETLLKLSAINEILTAKASAQDDLDKIADPHVAS